jgi:phytoene dehydrogenase-like protein
MRQDTDVVVVGAGHNALVAALMLARRGLRVRVLEEKAVIGGACRTERPFAKAPELAISTGAYLLGVMPPELLEMTGVSLPLLARDPHYFLPTTDGRYLLLGSDREAARAQFVAFFSEADWRADEAMQRELGMLREDLAGSFFAEPLTIEETAERYVRAGLRQVFVDLCRKPIRDYLERFEFRSDLVKAMYAATDGFTGSYGTWDTPGTGMNFLMHNMCRLPGSGGTWMLVAGGMGTVSERFADAARAAGAVIETSNGVAQVLVEGGAAVGVVTQRGEEIRARAVVVGADPFRMRSLVGAENFPEGYNKKLDGLRRDGTSLKVNLALRGLPRFTCLPEDRGQYGPTIHLLPDEKVVLRSLIESFHAMERDELPEFPAIDWYTTTRRCSCRGCRTRRRAGRGMSWKQGTCGTCWRFVTGSRRGRASWWSIRSCCIRRRSNRTSGSPEGTFSTWTTGSGSRTGCRTGSRSRGCTRRRQGRTRRAGWSGVRGIMLRCAWRGIWGGNWVRRDGASTAWPVWCSGGGSSRRSCSGS